ncbi:hypothetical protein EXIGLDRAFT_716437 [Exidia glandulosa HHB12029]|uniref:Uncharacterized protein n=1 Tax=Exidia glandulosa HHB12029 TaxID=1314781 RepID=A0A165P896_EXIGL|nr:hypothetical protein EXIGLDRAFT_716437 [Exidia glandulosa HHB12029]
MLAAESRAHNIQDEPDVQGAYATYYRTQTAVQTAQARFEDATAARRAAEDRARRIIDVDGKQTAVREAQQSLADAEAEVARLERERDDLRAPAPAVNVDVDLDLDLDDPEISEDFAMQQAIAESLRNR